MNCAYQWVKGNCLQCGDKMYDKVPIDEMGDAICGFEICRNCIGDFGVPFGFDGVNAVVENWGKYSQYIDCDYHTFYIERLNIEIELPQYLILAFYRFKLMMCLALNLHNRPEKEWGIPLDIWGSMGYEDWHESGYEFGRGFFKGWWVTEI